MHDFSNAILLHFFQLDLYKLFRIMVYQKNYLQLTLIVIAILMFHAIGYTQNYHFVYLQSANRQLFSVHIHQQDFTSTSGGYLIIPKLMTGKHQIQLQWQENPNLGLNFVIPVADQDAGYNITKSETGNWQLNGLSNELVIAATIPVAEISADVPEEKITNITNVTMPPGNPNKDSIAQQENNQTSNAAASVSSSATTMPPAAVKTLAKQQNMATANPNGTVAKTFEKMGAQGLDQIYVDKSQAKADTIAVFIPLKQAPRAEVQQPSASVTAPTPVAAQSATPMAASTPVDTTTHQPAIETANTPTTSCLPASKDDFNATRIAMASSSTDAAMIEAAKKAFEKKCYTIEQIKNLGMLFLSQQNRLQFFAAAKNHLVDAGNFPILINQFIDPNIIEQFKALEKK